MQVRNWFLAFLEVFKTMKRKCEWTDRIGQHKHYWIRCENKPEFIFITKPSKYLLSIRMELCKKHLKEFTQSWDYNNLPYETIKIKKKEKTKC